MKLVTFSPFLGFSALLLLMLPAAAQEISPEVMPDWVGPVVRVVDGDTFYIKFYSDTLAVRLKGVDTPETSDPRKPPQFGGAEASEFLKNLLQPGTVVRLQFRGDIVDNFGRLLAYAWVWNGSDWVSLQESVLKNGLGFLYVNYPFEYPREYFTWQQEAQVAGKGLWADPGKIENRVVRTWEELESVRWIKRDFPLPVPPVPPLGDSPP